MLPPMARQNPFRLIAWYAAHGEVGPKDSAADRFCHGAAQILVALRRLTHDRELRRAALIPTVLSLAAALVIALLFAWSQWSDGTARGMLLRAGGVFILLASLPPTLLHPLWEKVAVLARASVGLPPGHEEPKRSYVRVVMAESMKGARQALIGSTLGVLPVVMLLSFFPESHYLKVGALAVWAVYWITVDAFELPFEISNAPQPARAAWFSRWTYAVPDLVRIPGLKLVRKFGKFLHKLSRPWRREIAFTERRPLEVLGFATALGTLLAVPVLGLLFRSVAIIAATQLASHDPEFRAGEHQPGSTLSAHGGARPEPSSQA